MTTRPDDRTADGQDWTPRTVDGSTLWLPADAAPAPADEAPPAPSAPPARPRRPRPWDTWPSNIRAAMAGTVVVLAACWTVSFDAIVTGGQAAGIPSLLALVCPVIVDGEMAIGTLVLVSIARRTQTRTRVYVGLLILASVVVSMTANMAHPWTAWLVAQGKLMDAPWPYLASGIPSLWIALIVHQLVILWRHSAPADDGAADTDTVAGDPVRTPSDLEPVVDAPDVPTPRPAPHATNPTRPVRPGLSVDGRVAALVAELRTQAAAGRDASAVGVSELSKATGVPRTSVYRLLPDALSALSTFRNRGGGTAQEGVAA